MAPDFISNEEFITLLRVPGFWGKLFGKREEMVQFLGSATVWGEYPSFKGVSTGMESMLYRIWNREKHLRYKREGD